MMADTCLQQNGHHSPNGSVGVEPITSSAQNQTVDLINQSRSKSVGELEHESRSCVPPEPQTINIAHDGGLRRRAASLRRWIRRVLVLLCVKIVQMSLMKQAFNTKLIQAPLFHYVSLYPFWERWIISRSTLWAFFLLFFDCLPCHIFSKWTVGESINLRA